MFQASEKASADTTRKGFESNLKNTFGGKFQGFGIFNSTESLEKSQCPKCSPPFIKPRGATKFCGDCKADGERLKASLLANFQKHRKVVSLDRWCAGCDTTKTAAMMSKKLEICRKCAEKLKTTTGAEQRRIIAHILHNTEKKLRRAAL